VFSKPDETKKITDPHTLLLPPTPSDEEAARPGLEDIKFTEEDIITAIRELKLNSAPGPDGIPTSLLIKCKESIARPLYLLWRQSLDTGTVPAQAKRAIITPIHKGGPKGSAKNYRPIALTSHLVKVFEKIIRNRIYNFLEERNYLNTGQHGFRKGRSCLSQLLAYHDKLLHHLAEGNNVDTVFLDFAKAFDKVDHGILLHKVKDLGIAGKVGLWLFNFLTQRTQAVTANGAISEEHTVMSGVPQGSVLGPLFFLIMIGDIDKEVIHSTTASFADDTNICKSIEAQEDVHLLQEDLDKIYDWAKNNNMEFNDNKFQLLRSGANKDIHDNTSLLSSEKQVISSSSHVKCLGIHLNADGTFQHHITETIKKARRIAGWILRTFYSREEECLMTLWKALVQPILDYCSQLWSPYKAMDIQALESVQRSYTRQIRGMKELSYWERLKRLGLYSQQRRRERYSIIYVWKILEGKVPNPSNTNKVEANMNERTGRKCLRKAPPTQAQARFKSLLSASLPYSGPKIFNSLPRKIRDITDCSVDKFKSQLDNYIMTIPDQPPVPGYTSLCRAPTNSLPDQASLQFRDAGTGCSGRTLRL